MSLFTKTDTLMEQVEAAEKSSHKVPKGSLVRVGVDLGTAFTVLVVTDAEGAPLCCRSRRTEVVRDGLVVDYITAKSVVAQLKEEAEEALGIALSQAAIAVPPGTSEADSKTHRYVVEGAGLEVCAIEDEPTAANKVLEILDGAVVDIGGGTTGVSIFEKGKVVYTADEATGGTHFTYVIAGHYKIPFEEADALKVNPNKQGDVLPLVTPVVCKVASIINRHVQGYAVQRIVLCGGTSCLQGIERIIENETGVSTEKPANPFYVTPLGIALSCPPYSV